MKVGAGDPVTMIRESDNSIVMLANIVEKSPEINEITVLLAPRNDSSEVRRKIIATYLAGYNVIRIRSSSKRIDSFQRDAIRHISKEDLVGTEVIEDASDVIALQVLQSVPQLSIKNAIERMQGMAAQMYKDAIASLSGRDAELAQQVTSTEDAVKRFELYVSRNLELALQNASMRSQMGLRNPSDCLAFQIATMAIMRIASDASRVAAQIHTERGSLPKDLKHKIFKASETALASFEQSVQAVLNSDYALAVGALKDLRKLEDLVQTIASGDLRSCVVGEIMVSIALSISEINQAAIRLAHTGSR